MSSNRDAPKDQKNPGARWIGVLLSFFVPGFGLLRAGEIRRGIFWFVGLQVGSVVAALVVVLDFIPIAVGFGLLIVVAISGIWMWFDSFRPGRMTRKLNLLFIACLLGLALLPPLYRQVAVAYKIPTSTMEPTFIGSRDGATPDHVYANRLSYLFHKPRRGDLIAFSVSNISGIRYPDHPPKKEIIYLMRIVGLPGERIEIRDGSVFASGTKLGKADGIPPIHYTTEDYSRFSAKREGNVFIVGRNEYFVLGDNSGNSFDSRFWGCVPSSNIVGKITKIYYPFNRAGTPQYPVEKAP